MNKTKVDDMLIEMISPKIEEIERKFTGNQPLTQDDINTLLLKSQYNHINHLDQKLDETVESVKELKNDMKVLEQKFDSTVKELKSYYQKLEEKLTGDYQRLEEKFDSTVKELKSDYQRLEQKVTSDIKNLEQKFETLEQKFETFKKDMEATIQKALNKNMMHLVIVIGFFMTLSKLIDRFWY